MSDLRTRLRDVERVEPPDLWPDIRHREPRHSAGPSRPRVALAVAAAVVVAGVLVPLGFLSFSGGDRPVGGSDHRTITVKVVSEAMAPTLAVGQDVVVDVDAYLDAPPRRGDVIAYHSEVAPGLTFLKRVIGLPGERIEQRDGAIYVDGAKLVEPYVGDRDAASLGPWTVEAGHLFVAGDNRANSNDSRYSLGQVPLDAVIGKVLLDVQASVPAPPPPTAADEKGPHVPFVPSTYVEGDRVVMPVTLPDGTTAELLYPPDLDLASLGVQPDGSIQREDEQGRNVSDHLSLVSFYHGQADPGLFDSPDPIATFESGNGVPVALWQAADPRLGDQLLTYDLADWTLVVPVLSGLDPETMVASVDARQTDDGFAVLEARSPLILYPGPDTIVPGSLVLLLGDPDPAPGAPLGDHLSRGPRLTLTGSEEGCPSGHSGTSGNVATLCLGEGSEWVIVHVEGDQDFVGSVFDGIAARNIQLAQP